MRGAFAALAIAVALPAAAQDAGTLADIRQELAGLYVELQRLQRELSTTGAGGAGIGGETTLERIDAIEAALTQQTARVEALEARIGRVVADGTNRIGDLEFRVCELEPGCDIGEVGATLPLGEEALAGQGTATLPPAARPSGEAPRGEAPSDEAASAEAASGEGPELAVGEQGDFDRAQGAFDAGEFAAAADGFGAFTDAYPGSPLAGQAHFLRGQALERQGRDSDAARAYLDSFSGSPQADTAPQALLQLGLALGRLGQAREACVTLQEVSVRYPGDPVADAAAGAATDLGCG
jgi:tol-pal system protein YbgF